MLTPYASGSRGNLYEVYDGCTRVLLECGLPIPKMRAKCRRPLTDYAACLLTHEHKDHSQSTLSLMARGIDCYMTPGTAQAIGATGARLRTISPGGQAQIGSLVVKAFSVAHDCAEPCGYLIHSMQTGERLCFATDTAYLRYTFPEMTEVAIECNYSSETIMESALPEVVIERVKRTHFSLEAVLAWLKTNDLRKVRYIWLLHMSADHGNAAIFRGAIQAATGVPTDVAGEGIQWLG